MRVRVTARYIVGFDGEDHCLLKNGELVYDDDTIIYVGHSFPGEVEQTVDAGEALVSPGFIDLNALGDIDHDLLHQEVPADQSKSLLWSEEYFQNGSFEWMTPEEEAFKSLYAYAQLVQNGITTAMPITSVLYKGWAETYDELVAAVENASRLGLRIYLGPSYQSGSRVVKPDGTVTVVMDEKKGIEGLHRAVRFVQEFDGDNGGLVRGMLAPERIETIAPSLLVETRTWREKLGCPLRLHAAQGTFEFDEIRARHGKTPVHFLADLGFLGKGVLIPHAIYVDGYHGLKKSTVDELELLARSQTTVIHCPVIMARHGRALESFARYQRYGIPLAMGTDTHPPDMIQNIRIGSYIARVVEQSVERNRFADLFRAATLGGAQAIGREDLGRLAPGAKADLIIIDLSSFHLGALDDPIRTIMTSGSGRDVKTVIINGRTVMKDREIEGVDMQLLKKDGQTYFEKMRQGYRERDYRHQQTEALFRPSFPIREEVKRPIL